VGAGRRTGQVPGRGGAGARPGTAGQGALAGPERATDYVKGTRDPTAPRPRDHWCRRERGRCRSESDQGSGLREGGEPARGAPKRGRPGALSLGDGRRLHRNAGGIAALMCEGGVGPNVVCGAGYGRGAACGINVRMRRPRLCTPAGSRKYFNAFHRPLSRGLPGDRTLVGQEDEGSVRGSAECYRSLSIRRSRFRTHGE